MVEDRTVASAVTLDPPTAIAQTECRPTSATHSTPNPTDNKATASDDGTGAQSPDGPQLTGDAPVLMVGDANVASVAIDAVSHAVHFEASLGESPASDADRIDESLGDAKQKRDIASDTSTTTASATDADGVIAAKADPARPATSRPAVEESGALSPPAGSTANVDSAAAVSRQPLRASRTSTDSVAQTNRGTLDEIDARPNRAVRSERTSSVTVVGGDGAGLPTGLPDATLLQRFVADREQAAFSALVQRHGSLVFGVCQRVLGDYHAAQDASQATFVILARKAGMLDRNSPLGGWLYRVAYHLALRSRAVAARQQRLDSEAVDVVAEQDVSDAVVVLEQQELQQVIREELQSLPEKYRTPLTLCYFDGQSHADAARSIGVPRLHGQADRRGSRSPPRATSPSRLRSLNSKKL